MKSSDRVALPVRRNRKEWKAKDYKPGMQVAYIPQHADGDIAHYDVEFGFVTSVRGDTVYCRYWRKGKLDQLRTMSCSEGCDAPSLRRYTSTYQVLVDDWVRRFDGLKDGW